MIRKSDKYSFIVVKYAQAETAGMALSVVRGLAKEKIIKLKDVVAITKNEKGKIKLRQTADDSTGKGFLKGSMIGVLFGLLTGGAGWVLAGAVTGTAVGMFDKGIRNKIVKSLGKEMTQDESALALLLEGADWALLEERMLAHNFEGELIVTELAAEHLHEVDAFASREEMADEIKIPAALDEEE